MVCHDHPWQNLPRFDSYAYTLKELIDQQEESRVKILNLIKEIYEQKPNQTCW